MNISITELLKQHREIIVSAPKKRYLYYNTLLNCLTVESNTNDKVTTLIETNNESLAVNVLLDLE